MTAATLQRVKGLRKGQRLILMVFAVMFLVSVVRVINGTPDLTSSGTFGAALRLAMPVMLAGLGGLYAERTGIVNIGLEGMMIMGTWFGAWAGWLYGPWQGLLIGILGGALGGLIHALATVTFNVDHIVSGVAINILAFGGMRFLSVISYDPQSGGGAVQSPPVSGFIGKVDLPFLAGGQMFGWKSPDLFGWLEDQGWFLISDLGGLLKGLTANLSWATIIALALVPITWWLLWRTAFGLRLRSVGEHPVGAESLGVNVYRMKYIGVTISGALAGFGGAFLVLEFSGLYREGQTGGRGFIGLASMIIGNWRPGGTAAAAGLFGFADALQLRDEKAVHGLLLFATVIVGILAIRALLRRQWLRGGVLAAFGAVVLIFYLTSDEIPRQFVFFTPHITTLLVMAIAATRLRMPAADGKPYRKGETG